MAKIYVGERRTLRFTVENIEGKDFTISNAQYLVKMDDAVETSGTMVIDNDIKEISFLFAPTKAGIHSIEIKYDVGQDRMMSRFIVEVVE